MERREFLERTVAASVAIALAPVSLVAAELAGKPESPAVVAMRLDDPVEPFELRVGRGLLPIFVKRNYCPIFVDIQGLRAKLAAQHGIVMPAIRIRDFEEVATDSFVILVKGRIVDQGSVSTKSLMDPVAHRPIVERLGVIACTYADELIARPFVSSQRRKSPVSDDWIFTN